MKNLADRLILAACVLTIVVCAASCAAMSNNDAQKDKEDMVESSDFDTSETTTVFREMITLRYPEELFLTDANAVVIEYGETVEDITRQEWIPKYGPDHRNEIGEIPEYVYTEGWMLEFVGVAVNYVRIYDSTINFDIEDDAARFAEAKDGDALAEKYDDIIILPKFYAETLKQGDNILIFMTYKRSPYHGVSYGERIGFDPEYSTMEFISAFPVENGSVVVDDRMFEKDPDTESSYYIRMSLVEAINEKFKSIDESYPIFENGITLEDLGRYFELSTDPDTYNRNER